MAEISLIVKRGIFDKIASGEKKEDYRSPSIFNNRLLGVKAPDGLFDPRTDVEVINFFDGYSKNRRHLKVKCNKIRVDKKIEQGKTYVRLALELGEILS